jgi:phosphoglycerate dehydrogenase-like enzyme
LSLMKGITFHTRELKQDPRGLWRPALNPYGKRLSACVFGVVGLGRIGTAAALRAKAFGMDVVVYDPYISNGSELAVGVRRVHSLTELFSQCDIVSLHAPLSAETEKLINAEVLAASKPGLVLINTARGPIIDLDALYDALRADQIQAVGLDVLPVEPADPDHPLIKAWAAGEDWIDHRLLLTPHSAFFTPESVYDMRYKGGEVALTYLHEGRLQNCVNGELVGELR